MSNVADPSSRREKKTSSAEALSSPRERRVCAHFADGKEAVIPLAVGVTAAGGGGTAAGGSCSVSGAACRSPLPGGRGRRPSV
jgi:hypothetical protein